MPAPVGPLALTAIGTAVTVPYPSSAGYDTVVLSNASAFVCAVNIGGQQQWLQPFTTDLYPIDPLGVAVVVTPVASTGSVSTAALTATFYLSSETPAGTYPVPLTSLALTSIGGIVNTSSVSLTLGTPTIVGTGGVVATSQTSGNASGSIATPVTTGGKLGYLLVCVAQMNANGANGGTFTSIGFQAGNGWKVASPVVSQPSGGWGPSWICFTAYKIATQADIAGTAPIPIVGTNLAGQNANWGSSGFQTFQFGEGSSAWANNQALAGVQTAPMSWGTYSGSAPITGTSPALYVATIGAPYAGTGSATAPTSTYPGAYLGAGGSYPGLWYAGPATGPLSVQYTTCPAGTVPTVQGYDLSPTGLLIPL
jgi:hypothetical protein